MEYIAGVRFESIVLGLRLSKPASLAAMSGGGRQGRAKPARQGRLDVWGPQDPYWMP